MKFGVSLWLWTSPVTSSVIESYAPKISEMGFDTIEVPLEDPTTLNVSESKDIISDNGLSVTTCAAMGQGRDLIHPDKSVRDQTKEYIRNCLDAAAELDAKKFVGPLYAEIGRLWRASDEQRKQEIELLVNQLQSLSEYAQARDITICIEALNRFETSFLNLTSQVVEVVDQVNHPNCKILIDLFHAGIEEKSLGRAIRLAGNRLGHLQVAENDRGTPGTGQFDWDDIASALYEIGYDEHVVIETFSPDNEMLAKAAAIWRPLAASPDHLATNGLSFLKKLLSA